MPDTTTSPSLATLSMTSTVLGSDLLIPIAVSADERMSRPFFVTVQVLSSDGNIDADSLLKTSCTVSVGTGQWGPRYFNGIIRSFAPDGVYSRGIYSYTLEIVPTLWLLSQTEDCRIWPQKRSLEIIGEMLFDIGVQVFDTLIDQGDQPVREYTVQYNETDLDFMTRLIEEEGYFYFFVHSENEHRLVIANQNVAFQSIEAGQMTVAQTTNPALDTVSNWSGTSMIVAGKARMTDYDPTAPSKKLDDHRTNSLGVSQPQSRDLYRWPARAMQEEEVTKKVKWRLDAADTASWLGSGMSGNWLFFPGADSICIQIRTGVPTEHSTSSSA